MGNLIHVLAKERNLSDGAIGLAKRKGKKITGGIRVIRI